MHRQRQSLSAHKCLHWVTVANQFYLHCKHQKLTKLSTIFISMGVNSHLVTKQKSQPDTKHFRPTKITFSQCAFVFSCIYITLWIKTVKTSYSSISSIYLKVVSATLLLVYFLSLKESFCETKKNVSYFTSKTLFTLEKNEVLDI